MEKKVRPLTAAICTFVHHKGWCKSLHKDPLFDKPWPTGCPFNDSVILALFPPVIVGKIGKFNLRPEDARALMTPGAIILGD